MNVNVERRLTLKRYFGYLVHYLWVCVLLAAVFGAMLGAYKYMSDKSDAEEGIVSVEDEQTQASEAYERLSTEEMNNVEIAVSYYQQMMEYKDYLDKSIYMSQDPYNMSRTMFLYTVRLKNYNGNDETEKQTLISNILGAYTYYISRGEFISSLSEQLGIEPQYVSELISATKSTGTFDSFFIVSMVNDERIGDVKQQVEELIEAYKVDLGDDNIEYTIDLVDVYDDVIIGESLISSYQSIQTNLYNASSRLTTLKKAFSDDQLLYYKYKIHEIQINAGLTETAAAAEEVKVDIKFIIVGLLVGIVFYCAIVLFLQMQSAYILDTFEFTNMFGLRYLGVLLNNKDGDMRTSLLKKITYGDDLRMSYEDSLSFVALKLKLACQADNVGEIALISSDFTDISEERLADFVSRLEKEGIKAVKLDSILTNGANMERLFEINKCIVLEQTGKTRVKGLAKLINFCAENGMGVYGVVDFVE